MKIRASVKSVLTPKDLKGKNPILVECVNDNDFVEWNGKKIEAINFIGGLDGEAFDVKIFASRLWVPPKSVLEVKPNGKYYLKYKDDKTFEIAAAN